MSFAALVSHLTETCFGTFGEDAIYVAKGGDEIKTRAVINRTPHQGDSPTPIFNAMQVTLRLPRADCPKPLRGEYVLVGEEKFTFESVLRRDGDEIEVLVNA